MAIHIVLVEPEIPPNTGNIARSCAATGAQLHLVKPLGFSIDDRSLKRAGLDYWPFVKLEVHESLEEFLHSYEGRETKGLPKDFIAKHQENTIRIPMSADTRLRSLNLANSVNIVLFEALRQLDFPGLE